MKYRPEIDGLRALALIPVILFHAGFSFSKGGFVGVDIFFVISGYLITTIIITQLKEGVFSLLKFYERRARRILPALFLVQCTSLLLAWLYLLPSYFKDFSKSLIAMSVFASNILFWRESNYFDIENELKPLLHTWSLAIEGQYYVLFPILLSIFWGFRKRWIFSLSVAVFAASLTISQWGVYNEPSAAFYLLPTRVWEILVGTIIAFLFVYRRNTVQKLHSCLIVSEVASLMGLFMIGTSIFLFSEETPFPSLYALLPTIGTGLIIFFSTPETATGRFLSLKPIVAVGLVSYSAYLWHQPLFSFARHSFGEEPSNLIFIMLILLTFILAFLSWKFVEQPFRVKGIFSRKKFIVFSLLGSLVFMTVGISGNLSDGFRNRGAYQDLLILNYNPENRILSQQSWNILRNKSGDKNYNIDNNKFDKLSWYKSGDDRKRLLLIGNSHSKDLFNVFQYSEFVKKHFQIARYGAQISQLANDSFDLYSSTNYKNADGIIMCSLYIPSDLKSIKPAVQRFLKDGKSVILVKRIHPFYYKHGNNIADLMIRKYLHELKFPGKQKINIRISDLIRSINQSYYLDFINYKKDGITLRSNAIIDTISSKYSDVKVLDRMEYICDNSKAICYAINMQLDKYFYDYGHHTLSGAEFFGRRVDRIGWLDSITGDDLEVVRNRK